MAAIECSDQKGHSTTNISSLFRDSVLQRAGRPRKYEGFWFSGNKRIAISHQANVKETESHKEFLQTYIVSTMQQFNA